jgi:signal transduction histidine kinase
MTTFTLRQTVINCRAALAMLWTSCVQAPRIIGWRRLGVTAVAFALALLIFAHSLHPSPWQAVRAACWVALSGLLSIGLGSLAHWLMDHAPTRSVRVKLAVPLLLSILVVSVNVVLLARLLFTSNRDVQLVLGSLLFGMTVALVVSLPIIKRVYEAIARIETDARRIASGEYAFRMAEDEATEAWELAQLAHWYNLMGANILEAAARRASAEAERRQVITALSHDLRTPLSAIQIMIDAIAEGVVTDPATIERYHRTIQLEADHLTDLIGDLVELARLESGTVHLDCGVHRIEDAIADVVQMMQEQAQQRQVYLGYHFDDDVPQVFADYDRILRLLSNLLQNAVGHVRAGGIILIRVTRGTSAEGDPTTLVQVIDTGEGIAADHLPHVFTATYRGETSRTRHKGLADPRHAPPEAGLGLAIAARIVEAHSGHIWAASPLPQELRELVVAGGGSAAAAPTTPDMPGTVVSFSLPARSAREVAAAL